MRAPLSWWQDKPDLLARCLQPLGAIYGAITSASMKREGTRAQVPVICIGNFIAGGAGKTPTALALGAVLKTQGETIAFLSRGFGGALSGPTPVRVDASRHTAAQVGDEPLLLASCAMTFICTDRAAGARAATEAGASLIIMDDGLQNPTLHKDLTLCVVDAQMGHGNGLCLPAGPLRAPMAAQWPHVDGLVLIGDGIAGERIAREAQPHECVVLRAKIVPQNLDAVRNKRVYAFAGLGHPDKFFRTLRDTGAILSATQSFADHHPYTPSELAEIRERCGDDPATAAIPVTTEKDAMRIPAGALPGLVVLRVGLEFEDQTALADLIARKIRRG